MASAQAQQLSMELSAARRDADPQSRTAAAVGIIPWLALPCHARPPLLIQAMQLRICIATLGRITRWLVDHGLDTPVRLCESVIHTHGVALLPYQLLTLGVADVLLNDAGLFESLCSAITRAGATGAPAVPIGGTLRRS